MNWILLLNTLSLFFVILTIGVVLLWKYQQYISKSIFSLTLILLGLFFFDHLCNILEWSGIAASMDDWEDLVQILQPILFAILVYTMIQRSQTAQLAASEAKYRLLVDNQSDLITKLDGKGNFLFVSPSYCRLFGQDEKDLLGQPFLSNVSPEEQEQIRREMDTLYLPPYTCRFRQRAHTKYGWRHLYWSYRALLNEKGKPIAIIGIGRDITDQVQAEEEREKMVEKLQAKNRELQNLVYISSHDLQSPLVNIRGFSGELKQSLKQLQTVLNECGRTQQAETILKDISQALYFIDSSAEKMQTLIDGLLKLSRIGSMELTLQTVHMNSLINSIIDGLKFQIQKAGCEIIVENLPPCLSDLYQVNQVFTNLLDNSIKFLDPSRPGKIRITGQQKGKSCEYRVIDNGIGISSENYEKIFEIFHRLHPDGPAKGIGLGLAIVRRILDKLDGTIQVVSEPGVGSEFIVCLPSVPPFETP
ncbi:MAG TPA: ATP-binding protein [Anaerohalosphaeraceae bacterium]|nr:ATP-binding protein [Anaerohalosphaeraceae bacterium]